MAPQYTVTLVFWSGFGFFERSLYVFIYYDYIYYTYKKNLYSWQTSIAFKVNLLKWVDKIK